MERKTASLLTLGCRLNQADTALLCDRLQRMGFEIIPSDSTESPNLIIVNSCTVTGTAFRKSRQMLRNMRAENPQSYIVLTGCVADVDKDKILDSDEYDLILPNEAKKDIENILPRYLAYLPSVPKSKIIADHSENHIYKEGALSVFPFRSRAILKIQEGCDNFCTYCIVPYARGRERSRDQEETVRDFKAFLDAGFREIVLSGVNICNYRYGNTDLVGLLEKLLKIEGDFRIRLGSTEPGPILPDLLEYMAKHKDRICPFLHLPLQNGSDRILRAMGRKYFTKEYAEFVKRARTLIPNIHIGSDIIVGFPGETDKDFEASYEFIKSLDFANLHVFPFSPREGTPAAKMQNQIDKETVAERLEKMKALKEKSAQEYAKSLIGTEEFVLIETRRGGDIWEGWSGNYVKTRIRSKNDIAKKLLKVRFTGVTDEAILNGEII